MSLFSAVWYLIQCKQLGVQQLLKHTLLFFFLFLNNAWRMWTAPLGMGHIKSLPCCLRFQELCMFFFCWHQPVFIVMMPFSGPSVINHMAFTAHWLVYFKCHTFKQPSNNLYQIIIYYIFAYFLLIIQIL